MGILVWAARTVLGAALLSTFAATGCAPARPFAFIHTQGVREVAAARSYWTPARMARARPAEWSHRIGSGQAVRPGTTRPATVRVGALFAHDAGGDHFCTAGVVASPGREMLITAAHCVDGGKRTTSRRDIVFVPGYRDGATPFGVWVPRAIVLPTRWVRSSDPALDVAFIVLRASHGRRIQSMLGADRLGIHQGFTNVVRVTGYPATGAEPITCVSRTSRESRHQMRFRCGGFSAGTSGSPWVARFNPRTNQGVIVGVIGGYQRGGDSSAVSYSPYFGDDVKSLYQTAARLP